ncbi:hypothetical protein Mnod_7120 [Methylobacterium nodulans ORS 2060]|uniref:Uncharacterized protein n=1 Tax=Methylobacterium nodulans (strain LMG 21967 / CNCM I-2342 / ORS 2060) TaxID=460265 RepID=B8IK75_METNO|nr:hypothetical protein Mnod_7120 [Methylobacterium nodulans ORS 2060]
MSGQACFEAACAVFDRQRLSMEERGGFHALRLMSAHATMSA